jgi:hypothetical protein
MAPEEKLAPDSPTVQVNRRVPKGWVTKATLEHQIELEKLIVRFLLCAYIFLLVATVAIIFMQGFKAWGFQLDSGFLKWLGVATIGDVGGLLTLTFGAVFKRFKE